MSEKTKLPDDLLNIDPNIIDSYCREKGKLFAEGESEDGNRKKNKVTTSKLRNFFSKVASIRTYYRNPGKDSLDEFYNKIRREIILVKPTLAYAYGRDKNLKNFYDATLELIQKSIKSLDIELQKKKEKQEKENKEPDYKFESLDNFFTIIEGFVAYHKFYGGQE